MAFAKLKNLALATLDPKLTDDQFLSEFVALKPTFTASSKHRALNLPAFKQWLKKNDYHEDHIEFSYCNEEGYTLVFNKDIQTNEICVRVPRRLMLSEEEASKSQLGRLFENDQIVQSMPTLLLSLIIMNEDSLGQSSFWAPYLALLPQQFNIPLFFEYSDWIALKGTLAYDEALRVAKSILRSYVHIASVLLKTPDAPITIQNFTWSKFLWAVGVAMTRQNKIPSQTKPEMDVYVLIPVWDMCNHRDGEMTTYFNIETNCLETYSPSLIPKGQPFFMTYGERSNYELFLYSGFVPAKNTYDSLPLTLALSTNDPLNSNKAKVLERVGLPIKGTFKLMPNWKLEPSSLNIFVRILNMTKEDLDDCGHLNDDELSLKLFSCDRWNSEEEKKVKSWLRVKCTVLLRLNEKFAPQDNKERILDVVLRYREHENLFLQSVLQSLE